MSNHFVPVLIGAALALALFFTLGRDIVLWYLKMGLIERHLSSIATDIKILAAKG